MPFEKEAIADRAPIEGRETVDIDKRGRLATATSGAARGQRLRAVRALLPLELEVVVRDGAQRQLTLLLRSERSMRA